MTAWTLDYAHSSTHINMGKCTTSCKIDILVKSALFTPAIYTPRSICVPPDQLYKCMQVSCNAVLQWLPSQSPLRVLWGYSTLTLLWHELVHVHVMRTQYLQSTLKGTPTCSSHIGTTLYEPYKMWPVGGIWVCLCEPCEWLDAWIMQCKVETNLL